MPKITRNQYDELDRALSEVQDAEASGRVGSHAILIATLAKLGRRVMSVAEAIRVAVSLLSNGWRDENDD